MNFSISIRSRSMAFYETLIQTLPPRTVSDRTCFRRIASWLGAGVESGHFKEEIFERVLLYARESSMGAARNPNAPNGSKTSANCACPSPKTRLRRGRTGNTVAHPAPSDYDASFEVGEKDGGATPPYGMWSDEVTLGRSWI